MVWILNIWNGGFRCTPETKMHYILSQKNNSRDMRFYFSSRSPTTSRAPHEWVYVSQEDLDLRILLVDNGNWLLQACAEMPSLCCLTCQGPVVVMVDCDFLFRFLFDKKLQDRPRCLYCWPCIKHDGWQPCVYGWSWRPLGSNMGYYSRPWFFVVGL